MKRPLQVVLSSDPNDLMEDEDKILDEQEIEDTVQQEENEENKKLCIECGDQPAEVVCIVCDEQFCSVCFEYLHRTGKRKLHEKRPLYEEQGHRGENGDQDMEEDKERDMTDEDNASENDEAAEEDDEHHERELQKHSHEFAKSIAATRGEVVVGAGSASSDVGSDHQSLLSAIKKHSQYIPLRLSTDERKLLHLLEAALNVSEYTDKIDILLYSSKTKRMVAQLREMCSILAGLVVASDMKLGQKLFQDQEYAHNAEWFQAIFEVGRRYKVMNPEKMRDSFGKLMYMIMDSRLPEVKETMEFDLYKPIKTVYNHLEAHGCLDLLDDPLVLSATAEISPNGRSRQSIQVDIRRKEKAIELLAKKYGKSAKTFSLRYGTYIGATKAEQGEFKEKLTCEDIRQCLYSIGDYHAYLRANRQPIEQLIQHLHTRFDAKQIKGDYSLGIHYGSQGARLTHSHEKQYHYVNQSLTLWSQIMRDMFMLWMLADEDLTSSKSRYRLADTGQGLNRIKPCPQVSRAMHGVISKTQSRTGSWVGSSVVHLGDHTVPNALFFLDKYLQVPRILAPVQIILSSLDTIARDPFVNEWICSQFTSLEDLKETILCDFFKHAFDGSGADNFYDAGSCIDGRLTSAWNWANSISKKPYYKFFLVCGFTGFNGTDGF